MICAASSLTRQRPNIPAPGKAGIGLVFAFEHHSPGLPEPGRRPLPCMSAYQVLIPLISVLVWGAGCAHQQSPPPERAVSFPQLTLSLVFRGYTNGGHSATLQLFDGTSCVQQYDGPYVEYWNETDWKEYAVGPDDAAIRGASKHPRKGEMMTAPVPPGPARWRASVACVIRSHDVAGHVHIWSPEIQR
jgi:hypothetical protein